MNNLIGYKYLSVIYPHKQLKCLLTYSPCMSTAQLLPLKNPPPQKNPPKQKRKTERKKKRRGGGGGHRVNFVCPWEAIFGYLHVTTVYMNFKK